MISLRVLFFVSLAVRGLDYVRADLQWNIPINFTYKHGDNLNITLFLQNVPPTANYFAIYYQTEQCDKNIRAKYEQQGSQCNEPGIEGPVETGQPIVILKTLNKGSLSLFIELRNSNEFCSTKFIMMGKWKHEHAIKSDNKFRTTCLNQYIPCQINVDFGNKCEVGATTRALRKRNVPGTKEQQRESGAQREQRNTSPSAASSERRMMKSYQKIAYTQSSGRLTFESPDEGLPQDTVHEWYQSYEDGTLVGTIPPVKRNKSKFQIEYHKFDLNTYIHCKMNSTSWKKVLNTVPLQITPIKKYKKDEYSKNETYSELEKFNFTCENKAHTQVGWIDPTGAKITTYNTIKHSWTFTKTDNNSMLCCLNYNTYNTSKDEAVVERSIEIITKLIYKEPENQDNVMASSKPESHNSQEAQETLVATSSPKPEAPQSTTPTDKPHNRQHTDSQSNLDHKTKYYIGIASVAGIIILISLMYVVIKKCYRKYSDPMQTLQLETYASTNMVQYAELDLRPGNAPPPASTDDPTYAEIIGVLRPRNENVKN